MFKKILRSVVARVCDAAFAFRMGAGFPGDVNRTHPASIEPAMQSATSPATAYGNSMIVDGVTNTLRRLIAGDQGVTTIYGVAVRPYPIQDAGAAGQNGAQSFGAATPPGAGNIVDVIRSGYILVQCNLNQAAAVKGGAVFVRTAATAGAAIQGNYETADDGANNANLDATRYMFTGPQDAAGVAEIVLNP